MRLAKVLPIAFIGGVFLFSLLLPVTWLDGLPLCYFKFHTGLDCPGCGLTRAFIYLFHGKLRDAITMNAMAPVLVLWFGLYLVDHCYRLGKKRPLILSTPDGSRMISRLFLLLFLGQWVWKNAWILMLRS